MRPRARLISLIGEELISDEPVAVVELVKNAYDADATSVRIEFSGKNPNDPDTLTISDDGEGMSLETVLEGWFEPGTITKKRRQGSPRGRLYQGAKGVGRFAAARLAASLYMETKRHKASEGVAVLLEWGRFDDDSYLDEVEIEYQVVPLPQLVHGTVLTLVDLPARKHWTDADYSSLHDRLSRLISPFHTAEGNNEVTDFDIELLIPGHPDLTGKVEPHSLTKTPKYKLAGHLDAAGCFSGTLEIEGRESKQYSLRRLGTPKERVGCGPFDVEIRAWDRDRPGLTPYMLAFDESLTGIRQILNRYCGVSIYRDGFRVHPYGQEGNDWLSLDTRSRQTPTLRLANNQVIAAVRISRAENPELRDRTTREGLVHNPAYDVLREWFIRVLALLEGERYDVRPREETAGEEITALFEVFDMTEVVKEADERLGKDHPVAKLVRDKDFEIREGVRRLQDHYSRVMMAAGFGQLIDIVVHEIGAPLGRANRELAQMEKALRKAIHDGTVPNVSDRLTNIKAWLEQIANRRDMLIPKTAGRRGRATTFSVQDEIEGNLGLFEGLLSRQKAEPVVRAPRKPVVVQMSRAALGQTIANLLDNAIYWLAHHHGEAGGGRIDIRLTTLKHGFRITVADDGPAVPEEDRERVFDMNFSRKPNGMGLGLYIARQVIQNYGRLVYRDDGPLPGACFEATFDHNVGL